MDIRSKNDLDLAYRILHSMAATIEQATGYKLAKADMDKAVKGLKQDIRKYQREQDAKETETLVKDYGMDGYIVLYALPDVNDPIGYFEENEYMQCRPSQYDCTGQAFTLWYKVFKRHGRWMVYHRVGFDV